MRLGNSQNHNSSQLTSCKDDDCSDMPGLISSEDSDDDDIEAPNTPKTQKRGSRSKYKVSEGCEQGTQLQHKLLSQLKVPPPLPIAPTVDFAAFFRKESVKRGIEATAENTGAGAAAGILATPRVAGSVALKKQKQEKSASKGKGKGAAIL